MKRNYNCNRLRRGIGRSAVILALLPCLLAFLSCRDKLEEAMKLAGSNRHELQAVLDYFKDDPDTLKYASARYLIENMSGHYTYSGREIAFYDSAYVTMAQEPTQNKDSVFAQHAPRIIKNNLEKAPDIENITAEYLIQMIEEACTVWHSSPWCKEYDSSIFFEYVLPYRLLDEPLSLWREAVMHTYPYLMANEVRSIRGYAIEAENAKVSSCYVFNAESASGRQAALFREVEDSATFLITQPITASKSLYLCYSTEQKSSRAEIFLNGKNLGVLDLPPTFSLETFNSRRAWMDLTIPGGINKLTIKYNSGRFALDYINFASIEPLERESFKDFSSNYYQIENVGTGECISFDTLQTSLLHKIELKNPEEGDSSSVVRLDYAGFACWSVAAFKQDSIDLCLDALNYQPTQGTPIVQWKYVEGNNQKWFFLPSGDGSCRIMSKDCGLCLEAVPNAAGNKHVVVQNVFEGKPSQLWKLRKLGQRPLGCLSSGKIGFGSSIAEAFRIFDITNLFDWFYFKGELHPSATSLLRWKTGECRDETSYVVLLARAMGIPAAIDFTPHWGNRSRSHTWSVLIPPKGKAVTFYMGAAPGDTTNLFHGYKKPKVYRRQYKKNNVIESDLAGESFRPELFRNPFFVDVTSEYCPTSDIVRRISSDHSNRRIAYICVFDNEQWVPVDYGIVTDREVRFSDMGRDIMYVTAFCDSGKIVPTGNPYYITTEGKLCEIVCKKDNPITMTVNRKYPFMGKEDFFNFRMWGGRFQGANTENFKRAEDLYIFDGMTNGNWYEEPISVRSAFKYMRYIGPNGSFCNINEIVFFDENGKELKGRVIGTNGIDGSEKEKVFDGNILTGFHSVNPDGGWVGLKLYHPARIGKIRFIPRNDGNCVEVGDEYELCYWFDGGWKIQEQKIATCDTLAFNNVPAGALYILHDLTKGKEERIFTYEDRKQVWW